MACTEARVPTPPTRRGHLAGEHPEAIGRLQGVCQSLQRAQIAGRELGFGRGGGDGDDEHIVQDGFEPAGLQDVILCLVIATGAHLRHEGRPDRKA